MESTGALRNVIVVLALVGLATACGGGQHATQARTRPTSPTTVPTTVVFSPPRRAYPPLPATPPGLTTRVELATSTLRAGETEQGTLIIDNQTGAPITTWLCQPPDEGFGFEVGLIMAQPVTTTSRAAGVPGAGSGALVVHGPCMGPTHVVAAKGTTRLSFNLQATEALCYVGPIPPTTPECFTGGRRLAPGRYQTSFDLPAPLPEPTPITVEVIPAA